MGLLAPDVRIIQTALAFANLKDVASTKEVEDLFGKLRKRPDRFKTIPAAHFLAYQHDRDQLRRWLDAFIDEKGTTAATEEITRVFGDTVVAEMRIAMKRGKPTIVSEYRLNDVRGCYALAVALVVSNDAQPRLGRCKLEGCETPYFFDAPSGTSGRHKTNFCSPEHANAHKVRAYRKRHSTK